jgi:carboxyl-terminal processing protease
VTRRRPSRLPQILVVVAACLIAFSGGLITDHVGFPATSACVATTAAPQASGASAPIPTCVAAPNASLQNSSLYNEALAIVKQYYVGKANITDQQLLYGSIKGMVDALGDTGHSTYLTPQEFAAWEQSLSANVAGIGVMMSSSNNVFTINRVIPGSPAETAGVKAGDVIVAVDGASTTNMTFDEMASKIRGNAGAKVTITILHVGSSTTVDITITRANVNIPLADWSMIPGTHIADIDLTEFSQGAADQLQSKITAATKAGATSIILDLRGNPGGYASEAQDVASEFLPSGVVYTQQDANGTNTNISVNPDRTHNALPVVVLVDHNSASSAEIVAGALQDHGRAKIVGIPTFGTGTVLQQFPLSDGSVVILGTAWWLTPNGHRIFGVGIKPDETVQMPSGVYPTYPTDLASVSSTDFASSTDTQLLAAVKDLSQ